MCGIAGIIDLDRKPVEPALLLAMNQAIAHRGPDDEGYVLIDQASSRLHHYSGPTSPGDIRNRFPLLSSARPAHGFNIGLSHRRFSIIDLSSAGHQPFFDPEQEYCVVFNGEIYNYVEIRDELVAKGFTFQTRSDTEVLLAAYKCWGTDCFEKLNGFWALALYDSKKHALLLSRDRIGKKPLYWTKLGSRVYFASEIKALLRIPEIYQRRRVNEASASDWLVYDHRDLDLSTCFDGIYSLPSGSWSTVDESFPNHSTLFWKVPEERLREKDISVQEACRRLRQICEDAVRIRLRCDVPLGVELSGGLDSSVVLALAAQVYPGKLTSYTIRFPEEKYNEEPFARSVVQRCGVDYRVLDSPTENFWCQILPFTYLQEEPYHSPNMHISQVIWSYMRAAGTKVLLDGSGGDENFAGYGIYFDAHQRDNLMTGRVDRYFRNALLDSEAEGRLAPLSKPIVALSKEAIKQYAPEKLVRRFRSEGWPYYFTGKRYPRSLYPMSASQALHGYMTNFLMPYWLRSGDKVVMGMPIEARSPLIDYRVIELAFRLPVTYLIRNGWRKWIFRKAMEDLLPEDVVWRKKKMGFPFPYERFKAETNAIMEVILDRASQPFIDLSQKQSLKNNWKAMSFILWYELFFNENIDLLLDLQTMALSSRPASDYGFTPKYLRNGYLDSRKSETHPLALDPQHSTLDAQLFKRLTPMLPPRPSTLDPLISPSPSTLDTCPSSPLVTIAIPTYNRADTYFPQALQSALRQTYPNLEIIVSDNCSTDNTRAIVNGITDPRLRYFRHEVNIGSTNNMNFCLEQATGEYVLFLHDDDLIDEDFIDTCIEAIGGTADAGIIHTGTRLIDSRGTVLGDARNLAEGLSTDAFFRKWFSNEVPIHLCHTLFNAQRLREIGGFKSKHHCYDDTMAIVLLAAKYGRVDVREVKASFRTHGNQTGFATNINEWCEDSLALLNLMRDLAPENKDEVFREGLQFFSRANYGRARMATSPCERFIASIKVLKYFKFRQLPSFRHFLSIFYGTPLYELLRQFKRNWKYVSSRA